MPDIYDALRNLGSAKGKKRFRSLRLIMEFFDCSWRWLLGGLLAGLPVFISFILLPVEAMNIITFLNNVELVYVAVTMAVIAFCDGSRRISGLERTLNNFVIIVGASLYGMLKGGIEIPILNEKGLYTFNIIFLIVVTFMGLLSYLSISFDNVRSKR